MAELAILIQENSRVTMLSLWKVVKDNVEGRFAEAAIRHISSALRASPKVDVSSRSPDAISVPISPPGATASSACRSAGGWYSRQRWPDKPMPVTAPASRRGSP